MITRRGFLRGSAMAAGTLALRRVAIASLLGQQPAIPSPPPNSLMQSMRVAGGTTPIRTTKLTDTIFLLQGVGGNMVAQIGPDGKLLIDSSVDTAARAIV